MRIKYHDHFKTDVFHPEGSLRITLSKHKLADILERMVLLLHLTHQLR